MQFSLEVEAAQADLAALVLHEGGCTGTQIDDRELVLDESEDASFSPRSRVRVVGYADLGELQLDAPQLQQQLEAALSEHGIAAELVGEDVDDTDWATQWRENFPPLEIGRFRIVPSWQEQPEAVEAEVSQDGLIPIQLDPGLAFGTGQHPTTFLCLQLLGDEIAHRAGEIAGASTSGASTSEAAGTLIDVGCGSGILSIAAAKLARELGWPLQVLASDLDEWCVQATQDNARDNGVPPGESFEVALAAGAAWTSRTFDIVVANLMSDLLISLAGDLRARCHPASTCILSGISSPRADDVQRAMEAAGFEAAEKREREGDTRGDYTEKWAAFVLRPRTESCFA
jgi:ribosomal protein L11 methyltransferase